MYHLREKASSKLDTEEILSTLKTDLQRSAERILYSLEPLPYVQEDARSFFLAMNSIDRPEMFESIFIECESLYRKLHVLRKYETNEILYAIGSACKSIGSDASSARRTFKESKFIEDRLFKKVAELLNANEEEQLSVETHRAASCVLAIPKAFRRLFPKVARTAIDGRARKIQIQETFPAVTIACHSFVFPNHADLLMEFLAILDSYHHGRLPAHFETTLKLAMEQWLSVLPNSIVQYDIDSALFAHWIVDSWKRFGDTSIFCRELIFEFWGKCDDGVKIDIEQPVFVNCLAYP